MSTRSERIKALIEHSEKTYQELEKETGIKKSSLQRYASGTTTKIPLDVIEKLSETFNVSKEYLMGWDEESPVSLKLTPSEEEHIKKYRTLDEYGKKNVDNVLDNEYTRCSESKVTFLRDVTSTYQVNTLAAHERSGATEEEKQADYDLLKKYINRSENNE